MGGAGGLFGPQMMAQMALLNSKDETVFERPRDYGQGQIAPNKPKLAPYHVG
jgi:hypothetical protein